MPKALDLTGQQFGYLKAIRRGPNKGKKTSWWCECQLCGTEKLIQTTHLTTGASRSCGCQHFKNFGKIINDEKQCKICGQSFIPNNINRKYCYDCSPEGLTSAERQRFLDRKLKHFLVSYKGGKCEKCGYNKCEGALQFHHRNPEEKEFTIGNINFGGNFNLDTLLVEVDKCELLCANCHAEKHYKES